MMKIVGIATISISVVAFGFLKFSKLKNRPLELGLFIDILSKYLSDLKWKQLSLSEVIAAYENERFNRYIENTNKLLIDNDYVYSFFEGNNFYSQFHLSIEDSRILKLFFERTGKSSLESEIELCKKVLSKLEFQKEEADSNYKKSGLLALKLSLIFGVWLAVILI